MYKNTVHMHEIEQEGVIVKQKNRIEELKQEKSELGNVIKEQKEFNLLAMEERVKFSNKLMNVENEIRGIKRKITELGKKKEKKGVLDKLVRVINEGRKNNL
ncbi:MAG: hypothetical protein DRN30_06300 [Thermoplasmata archaeon]|nr:MAG: hypothetical protein DRN30_06300 [Thermoplasmata archaeon]